MGCNCTKLVFQPPSTLQHPPHNVILHTKNNVALPAIYINQKEHYTLLISHGNAENIGHVFQWVKRVLLQKLQVNVMIYEYTGYSPASGRPSERSVYADSEAALAYLTEVRSIPRCRILVYGRSLGTGPSCYLAEKYEDLAGVILQTPIASIYRVLVDFRFTLPGDMFPNVDRVGNIEMPMLIIHGTRDEVVSMEHAKGLFQLCKSPHKRIHFVEGAGHNNIEAFAGQSFFDAVNAFMYMISTLSLKE